MNSLSSFSDITQGETFEISVFPRYKLSVSWCNKLNCMLSLFPRAVITRNLQSLFERALLFTDIYTKTMSFINQLLLTNNDDELAFQASVKMFSSRRFSNGLVSVHNAMAKRKLRAFCVLNIPTQCHVITILIDCVI